MSTQYEICAAEALETSFIRSQQLRHARERAICWMRDPWRQLVKNAQCVAACRASEPLGGLQQWPRHPCTQLRMAGTTRPGTSPPPGPLRFAHIRQWHDRKQQWSVRIVRLGIYPFSILFKSLHIPHTPSVHALSCPPAPLMRPPGPKLCLCWVLTSTSPGFDAPEIPCWIQFSLSMLAIASTLS